jgi:RNA polymerase sigma factor (sigma-70 family)
LEFPETITHEEMVDRCKRGDATGYTALYNLHAKEVYNTIYRIVHHTAEAEDLLQETFVAAFQAIGGYEHTGGFRAWIKRIAINKSITWLRKRKLKLVELDTGGVSIKDDDPIDEKAFEFKVEEVRRAIDALPEGDRVIVQLYLFENIPQVEIAQMLGMANDRVRIQYHRAKQKVLRILKEGGYHEN